MPASPAWGATAAAPAFFNPNATAQAQAQAQARRRIRRRRAGAGVSGGGVAGAVPAAAAAAPVGRVGSEDSAAQWGYAQQQQWHAGM